MTTSLAIAFAFCGVSLVCSLMIYVNHRRSGTPVPGYEIGAMMGSIGLPLILAGTSTPVDEGVAIVLVIVGSLLTIGGAAMVFRARRRMRSGRR